MVDPGPLRGMKLWTTEAGFRVAGIVKPLGAIQPGKVVETPISSLDLLPTFCSMAGVMLPKVTLDGMNIGSIASWSDARTHPTALWFYYNAINEQRAALRDGKWKLLARLDGGKLPKIVNVSEANRETVRDAKLTDFSLYDLEADMGETNDLRLQQPAKFEELKVKMDAIYRELLSTMHVWPKS